MAYHNDLRTATGGAKFNMLTYDPKLEIVAQGWTDQCYLGHNPNRTEDYASVGGTMRVGTRERRFEPLTLFWRFEFCDCYFSPF